MVGENGVEIEDMEHCSKALQVNEIPESYRVWRCTVPTQRGNKVDLVTLFLNAA